MRALAACCLLVVMGCTPAEHGYCEGFGLKQGEAEYSKCLSYYYQQQALFDADRAQCAAQADVTYPRSLYSQPQSFPMRTWGPFGPRTEMVHQGADYRQHAELDALRMRIIQPCMDQRGWLSPSSWQAGRHTGPRMSQLDPNGAGLPWLK